MLRGAHASRLVEFKERLMSAMKQTHGILLAAVLLAGAAALNAAEPFELSLWPGAAPGSERSTLR
jgi:hypothetical protein